MKFRVVFIALLILSGIIVIAINQAPQTSSIQATACIQNDSRSCIRFPTVRGDTLNRETVTLPDFFASDYNLVILAFNREQQENVIDWLPIVQDLQAEYDELQYYSLGALPDVPPGVRLLISGGMSLAVESNVRDKATLAYLDDQMAFADALGLSRLDEPRLFILNSGSEVIWNGSGVVGNSQIEALLEQVAIFNTN